MLFNSYEFLLLFLPITLLVTVLLQRKVSKTYHELWLIFCSIFFYAWWEVSYLIFLTASIVINYEIVKQFRNEHSYFMAKTWLRLGFIFNLGLLAYFKYSNFFIDIINSLYHTQTSFNKIGLPLAISFVTFQQIAFLVDEYRNSKSSFTFAQYTLFITFFPQLIAGPIVYLSKIIPQYTTRLGLCVTSRSLSLGLSLFCFGLFKKVIIADSFEPYSQDVFSAAYHQAQLTFIEAWGGALCYSFQLYFDFSGYSDMAIGLARMFNIVLPINFDSPYKSKSIIEFWRRWHITLSDFLKNYLYIPLGGNRLGVIRKNVNLLITMLLGGLWHGAGYTFIIWGFMHGIALVVNHLWHDMLQKVQLDSLFNLRLYKIVAQLLTFIFVVYAWVFFRANDLDSALLIVKAMSKVNGLVLPEHYYHFLYRLGFSPEWLPGSMGTIGYFKGTKELLLLACGFCLAWALPNTKSLFLSGSYSQKGGDSLTWSPSVIWSGLIALMSVAILLNLTKMSTFLYYQF